MAGLTEPRAGAEANTQAGPAQTPVRRRLHVRGIVQGVGFRPFVYNLAVAHGLAGFVRNDSSGVFIELEGPDAAVAAVQEALRNRPPPLAHIEAITAEEMALQGEQGFAVVESTAGSTVGSTAGSTAGAEHTFVSPDQALCADCRRELFDPRNRRYLYPFINCTNCGPRYTIIRSIPYDRPATTMAGFPLCPDCRREYTDPGDRRFHAQPNACPVCGPQVTLHWSQANPAWAQRLAPGGQAPVTDQLAALRLVQAVLAGGGIAAVKGIGGFHLACDAASAAAVQLLRTRKARPAKPFAVMAADEASVRRIAHVDDAELRLLNDQARPIVLLRKRADGLLAAAVAPGNGYVGVMLPYSPLHELLLHALPGAMAPPPVLVMTSGNLADEPIVYDNAAALEQLDGLADVLLLHNREIHAPCDDSVVRIFQGCELPVRRSRGYAPFPVALSADAPPILAVGAELKSTFCLAQGRHALLSPHIGDLSSMSTLAAFERTVRHMSGLFRIAPEIIACDLHPGYLSTAWAKEHAAGRPLIAVQHHHAHIAAVLAEHGVDRQPDGEPVIGFSFDGTGYGTDGAVWGGEVLLATYGSFTRAGHLRYTPLPGGDAAIKRPYRVALAQLWAAGEAWDAALPPVAACPPAEQRVLLHQVQTGLNALPTSSMGRLCDAVAALAGVRQVVDYEAQAAIELEALAQGVAAQDATGYRFAMHEAGGMLVFDGAPVIRAVAADVRSGVAAGLVAARFHAGLAALIVELAVRLHERTGIGRVALSGGVFQNVTLLAAAVPRLEQAGFVVLTHRRVPPNDGGLALGQAAAAGRIVQG